MSSIVTGTTVIQLGTLSSAANQQITQAVANSTAAAATATAASQAAQAGASTATEQAVAASQSATAAAESAASIIPSNPQAINFTQANSARFISAIGRAAAWKGRARFIFPGDSTPAAFAAVDGSDFGGARHYSYPLQLAVYLNAQGYRVQADSLAGDGGITNIGAGNNSTLSSYEYRIGASGTGIYLYGNTVADGNTNVFGGAMLAMAVAGDQWQWTATDQFDTLFLLSVRDTVNQGSFEVTFTLAGGGTSSAQTFANTGSSDFQYLEVTVPNGALATAAQLKFATGGAAFALIGTRLSTNPGIEIINAGCTGQTMQNMAMPLSITQPGGQQNWNYQAALKAITNFDLTIPNVIFTQGGGNDIANAGRSIAQCVSDAQSFWSFIKANCPNTDIVHTIDAQTSGTWLSTAQQDALGDAMSLAAVATGIPVIDFRKRVPPYAILQPVGGMYAFSDEEYSANMHGLIANLLVQSFHAIA